MVATGVAVVAVCGVSWWWMSPAQRASLRNVARRTASVMHPRSAILADIRHRMDAAALDVFLASQRECAERSGSAADWRILAEACLERILLASSRLGMAVGRPTFAARPPVVTESLDLGEAAIEKARALGDQDSEVPRIAAGLLANKIDGALAAIRYGSKVDALIEEAATRDDGNPHIAVARGCRLVFAPEWLGGDPPRARALFVKAAEALAHDERPLVFAAFAAYTCGDVTGAQQHLQAAVERNANNAYAREVLRRLQAGEDSPFGRDLAPP